MWMWSCPKSNARSRKRGNKINTVSHSEINSVLKINIQLWHLFIFQGFNSKISPSFSNLTCNLKCISCWRGDIVLHLQRILTPYTRTFNCFCYRHVPVFCPNGENPASQTGLGFRLSTSIFPTTVWYQHRYVSNTFTKYTVM